ncbi:MAG: M81 family metallopeptidase [Planctomycetales bacterium]|nr:M81 family metallopeptidase [Planctomycetales bacterium]
MSTPKRRILLAECIHEVCSFNPVPSRYDDFFVNRGEQLLAFHRGIGSEVSGALSEFTPRSDIEVVPTFGARGIASGGTIPAADFDRLAGEFLDSLRTAGPVDAAYFALHGAMAAEQEDDPEGFLLAEARKILGPDIPIVASFDLHGVLTDRMLEHTNAIVLYHTYPHVDFFETGQHASRLLLRLLAREIKPVTAIVEIPALVRGDELITRTGVYGRLITEAQTIEHGPGGLSAGLFIGNPFTDVPNLRCYSVVTTDNDPDRASREALRLANEFWQLREQMQARLTPLDESVHLAAETQGTVILVDAADATSSGASGDSNAILRQLVLTGYRGRALLPIVDLHAVEAAFAQGVGGTVQTQIGGALDRRRFTPLTIIAQVKMLSDGRFRSESFHQEWFSGRTAVLQTGSITLVVTSRPVHLFDRSLFFAHGQDPRHFDLVVVKSPHCQSHMFADWCTRLINVDAPGSTSANLPTLGHTRCRRPIFPLDRDVTFQPRVRLFSR